MATGRIGVTPVLRTRWSDQPTAGTTVLSGLDDNSVALVYDAGYEAVYRNGVLLSRGNDYTATNGTTVTLIDATLAGDIIEIFANDLVPLTDAISKGQYTAKGALLSASAASTPGVLTVGSNDQVLTADSTAVTGLKWATPSSVGKVLQVVSASTSTEATNTTTTFATTNLTATITPTSATSKVLVLVSQNGVLKDTTAAQAVKLQLLRGATVLSSIGDRIGWTNTAIYNNTAASFNWLDSPATTSATTYKTEFAKLDADAGSTVYVQNSNSANKAVSTITLMEIGA